MRFHRTGTKRLRHPVVGDLELSYESMELSADDGLTLNLYTAEAGSLSQHAWTSWRAGSPRPPRRTRPASDRRDAPEEEPWNIGLRTVEHLESQLAAADVVLDAALLDRIDEIVPPGTSLNPADAGWIDPALNPAVRRR